MNSLISRVEKWPISIWQLTLVALALLAWGTRSYWQTMRKSTDDRYTAGGFGTSEDHLVKRPGQWLIQSRKLVVFTE